MISTLKLKNTKTGELEDFKAINPNKVLIYSCGPTVYSEVHIGNLRSFVFADILRRSLNLLGYKTKSVMNITDVGHLTDNNSDKIEEAAKENKLKVKDVVKKYTNLFFTDLDRLNVPRSKFSFPKASEYIQEQIKIIKDLEEKGYAYKLEDGIYFDVKKFEKYGELGIDDSSDGYERINVNEDKRDRKDFALWKFSEENRQQIWDSPWGRGFPGWHIECSAMAINLLGEQIDIHTGGTDLARIHHNNEIAQSEASTGKNYVNYWLHVAFLNIDGEKVSKSLKNTITLNELIERKYHPLALRMLFLQSNYRSFIHFNFDAINASQTGLERMNKIYYSLPSVIFTKPNNNYVIKIKEALEDDINTAKLVALCFDALKDDKLTDKEKKATLKYADKIMGILSKDVLLKDDAPQEIIDLAEKRLTARKNKDYKLSDEIREEIKNKGYSIEDMEDGYIIEKN